VNRRESIKVMMTMTAAAGTMLLFEMSHRFLQTTETSGDGELGKRAAQSKVAKMIVSSVGTKAAGVGTTDSSKRAQNARWEGILCPDFVVTISPYAP
jgi:glycerate kinase